VLTALGLGAVGYATPSTFYFSALTRIDASMVALVLYTYPALVTLAAALLGRDRLTPARTAALVVASCGTLLVLLGAGALRFDPIGVALAMAAALTYTAYVLMADTAVHQLPPVVLTALVMTGAALALIGRAAATGGVNLHLGLAGWFWVTCMAVVSTVVGMLAFFAGLRRTGPSTASILSTFEPVTTTALAALVLHEFLTSVQLAGGLLVLVSVAVVQLRPPRGRPTPQTVQPAVPDRFRTLTGPSWSMHVANGQDRVLQGRLVQRTEPPAARPRTRTPVQAVGVDVVQPRRLVVAAVTHRLRTGVRTCTW
jgi:drug/metabolite transporter (DMT)-like permease